MSNAIVEVQLSDELVGVVIDEALVERAVRATLTQQQTKGAIEVSVYVTTAEEIHQYNRDYRKIER